MLSDANKPKATPSFQINWIFKNFDKNISELKLLLSRLITNCLEIRSIKKINNTIIKSFNKFFLIIKGVLDKDLHLFSNKLDTWFPLPYW